MRERVTILAGPHGRGRPPWSAPSTPSAPASSASRSSTSAYPGFVIYDESDQMSLVRMLANSASTSASLPRAARPPSRAPRASSSGPRPSPAASASYFAGDDVARSTPRYQAGSSENGALDFDDLLLDGRALHADPDVSREVPGPLPVRARRRVPGHEHRPVRPRAPAGPPPTATSASSATPTSPSTSGARTSATSSTSSGTSREAASSTWSRTTAPPRRSSRSPRVIAPNNQPRKEKNLWTENGHGDPARTPGLRRERGGGLRGPEGRRLRADGRRWAGSPSSTGPTPSPASSRTRSSRASPTVWSAAPASTNGGRSRTSSLTSGSSQPHRRPRVPAGPGRAAPRDRADHARPPRGAGGGRRGAAAGHGAARDGGDRGPGRPRARGVRAPDRAAHGGGGRAAAARRAGGGGHRRQRAPRGSTPLLRRTGHRRIASAIAPMLGDARISAPLTSQLVAGEVVTIMDGRGDWLQVRGPDAYEGWTHAGYLMPSSGTESAWRIAMGCQVRDAVGAMRLLPLGARIAPGAEVLSGSAIDAERRAYLFPPEAGAIAQSAESLLPARATCGAASRRGDATARASCSGFTRCTGIRCRETHGSRHCTEGRYPRTHQLTTSQVTCCSFRIARTRGSRTWASRSAGTRWCTAR